MASENPVPKSSTVLTMTKPGSVHEAYLTMSGIAALAGVQRPVVSMWRKRPRARGRVIPFPKPADYVDGVERFSAREIVEWLELSGRGTNPEARDDALAHSAFPDFGIPATTAGEGAEGLLALKARTGAQLTSLGLEELLDLSDAEDPDDEAIYSEILALGPTCPAVAAYVDELVDAAYDTATTAEVLEALLRTPLERPEFLADKATNLMGAVTAALARELPDRSVLLVDPDGRARTLIAAAAGHLEESRDYAADVRGDGKSSRRTRRRLICRGVSLGPLSADQGVVGIINAVPCGGSALELLAHIEDVCLDFTVAQPVVVIGPATVLCDELSEPESEQLRAGFLRGRLRCAVRLPEGMSPGRPRERLGLWVLGAPQDFLPVGQRWFGAGDLTDDALGDAEVDAIATDVVACTRARLARAHAFTSLRLMRTSDVLAEAAGLVPLAVSPERHLQPSAAERVVTIRQAFARLAGDIHDCQVARVRVDPSETSSSPPTLLGELVDRGVMRVHRGTRIDIDGLRADGAVSVFTTDDVLAHRYPPAMGLGALEFVTDHPRAQRTEPGDVVFVSAPAPAAVVDRDGGNAVCSPARILRVPATSGLSVHGLVAVINGPRVRGRDWRAWPVPVPDPAAAPGLDEALRLLEEERAWHARRASDLARLAAELAGAAGHVQASVTVLSESHKVTENVTISSLERGDRSREQPA